MTTRIHVSDCACPFCVLESQDIQLCDVKVFLGQKGLEVFFPKTHSQYATPENGLAISRIMSVMLTDKNKTNRITAWKRGHAETLTFGSPKGSTMSLECLIDKRAWKICFHVKKTAAADEDPS